MSCLTSDRQITIHSKLDKNPLNNYKQSPLRKSPSPIHHEMYCYSSLYLNISIDLMLTNAHATHYHLETNILKAIAIAIRII